MSAEVADSRRFLGIESAACAHCGNKVIGSIGADPRVALPFDLAES
jgi:hypothetical protein